MSTRPAAKIPYTTLLAQLLQHYRQQRGLQQSDVAAALGILQPAYSRIEKGDTSITVTQLRIIARTLNMRPSRILDDADRWTQTLRAQGVTVTDEKEVPQAALLVGLGILAAALLAVAN